MAQILTREKELFHINQELNMMAINPADDGSQMATQPHYGTYLKQKGPSTLLKKKNNIDTASSKPFGTRSTKLRTPVEQSPVATSPRGRPVVNPTSNTTKSKMPEWRQTKGNYSCKSSSAQQAARIDTTFTRRASHKTSTYVKYRNPNFKQSPSLDLLLRCNEEWDTQQQQQQQQQQQPVIAGVEVMQQSRESTTVVSGQSKKQLTQDNFIRFLKAKVKILEEDHGQLTQDMADQKEQLNGALDALRKAECQRDQALNSNVKLSEQLHRLELQSEDANRRHKELQVEYNNQQHELEQLRRDTKLMKQTNANLENRLIRVHDDAESTRKMLEQQTGRQREDSEYARKEFKVRDNRIKALKRQRADLLNAYKKQLFLIDNLKRQNSCVEQAVAIGFGEKEFNKVLEWNTGSKAVF